MAQENPLKVAIIGAGTIGLYLAWRLSKAGHDITVFEKNKKIENKACSGLVSERINNFLPLNTNLIENKINSCQVHFPKKTIILNFRPTYLVIDRPKGAKLLLGLAKKSGAKILFGKTVNEIPQNFDRVIGCDGALSKVRESLGLPFPRFKLGLQVFLPVKNFSDYVETWPTKNGFFWKIPHGSQTEYGALGPLNSIRKEFEKFCQNQKINFDQKKIKAALIPQGLILSENENITLCGDAAGLTKPWSGGGVIWGLTAADILIKNFPDFTNYSKELKSFFGSKIFLGQLSNNLVHFLGNNLPFFLPQKKSIDNDFLFG